MNTLTRPSIRTGTIRGQLSDGTIDPGTAVPNSSAAALSSAGQRYFVYLWIKG